MNELLITILLVIPSPDKLVSWTINEVPTQVQLIHKTGLQVSYNATRVPCHTQPKVDIQMLFSNSKDNCYLVLDLQSPVFIRHPDYWHNIDEVVEVNVLD